MPSLPDRTIDLTGHTYGWLLVLAYAGVRKSSRYWTCRTQTPLVRDYY